MNVPVIRVTTQQAALIVSTNSCAIAHPDSLDFFARSVNKKKLYNFHNFVIHYTIYRL